MGVRALGDAIRAQSVMCVLGRDENVHFYAGEETGIGAYLRVTCLAWRVFFVWFFFKFGVKIGVVDGG